MSVLQHTHAGVMSINTCKHGVGPGCHWLQQHHQRGWEGDPVFRRQLKSGIHIHIPYINGNQGATKSLPTICLFERCLGFIFSYKITIYIYIYVSGSLGPTISLNPTYIPLRMIDRGRGHGLHPQFKQLKLEMIIVHVSNIVQLLMNRSL